MSEGSSGALTGRDSSKSQFNWTIVKFNLRLFEFRKAIVAWIIKQDKGGRSTSFSLYCINFPYEKL